eukprot:scaffold8227_cov72-Phaeocystis_antarctica.AAC.7
MVTSAAGRGPPAGTLCGLCSSVGAPAASSVTCQPGCSHLATSASVLVMTTLLSPSLCAMRAMPAASSIFMLGSTKPPKSSRCTRDWSESASKHRSCHRVCDPRERGVARWSVAQCPLRRGARACCPFESALNGFTHSGTVLRPTALSLLMAACTPPHRTASGADDAPLGKRVQEPCLARASGTDDQADAAEGPQADDLLDDRRQRPCTRRRLLPWGCGGGFVVLLSLGARVHGCRKLQELVRFVVIEAAPVLHAAHCAEGITVPASGLARCASEGQRAGVAHRWRVRKREQKETCSDRQGG